MTRLRNAKASGKMPRPPQVKFYHQLSLNSFPIITLHYTQSTTTKPYVDKRSAPHTVHSFISFHQYTFTLTIPSTIIYMNWNT